MLSQSAAVTGIWTRVYFCDQFYISFTLNAWSGCSTVCTVCTSLSSCTRTFHHGHSDPLTCCFCVHQNLNVSSEGTGSKALERLAFSHYARSVSSLPSFKSLLKTHLFSLAFSTVWLGVMLSVCYLLLCARALLQAFCDTYTFPVLLFDIWYVQYRTGSAFLIRVTVLRERSTVDFMLFLCACNSQMIKIILI